MSLDCFVGLMIISNGWYDELNAVIEDIRHGETIPAHTHAPLRSRHRTPKLWWVSLGAFQFRASFKLCFSTLILVLHSGGAFAEL